VEKALERKLNPLIKQLAESEQEEPSLQDIIGGLGYIFGLVGAVAYFRYRRKGTYRSSGK